MRRQLPARVGRLEPGRRGQDDSLVRPRTPIYAWYGWRRNGCFIYDTSPFGGHLLYSGAQLKFLLDGGFPGFSATFAFGSLGL